MKRLTILISLTALLMSSLLGADGLINHNDGPVKFYFETETGLFGVCPTPINPEEAMKVPIILIL